MLNYTRQLDASGGECGGGFAAPVTSAGRLFTASSKRITGYNQWSGQVLWDSMLPGTLWQTHKAVGAQVVDGQLVVITTDCTTMDPLSRVFVLDAATGVPVLSWGTQDGGVRDVGFAVIDGVIVTSESTPGLQSCEAYTLSGTPLWSSELSDSDCWAPGAVATAGRFFVRRTDAQDGSQTLAALRVTDGATLWSKPVDRALPVAVAQDGKDLYATEGTTLLAIDPSTGRTKREIAGRGSEVMAVNAGTVFTACAGTALCATRRSDGSSLWTRELGRSGDQIVVAGGVVYYAGRAFRAYQGTRIRNASDGNPVTAVAGGRIYTFQINPTSQTAVLKSYK